jgi:hypothetical protein
VLCTLLAGCRFEFDHQFSGHPAAVFHPDALPLGPLTDLSGVQPARRSPEPAAGGPTGPATDPPPSPHIGRQRVPQLLRMLCVQVDLVLRAVQPEADHAVRGAAVQVIDEEGLHLLGHGCSIPHSD